MYQSSSTKKSPSSFVAAELAANRLAASWNGKSSTPCTFACVVKCDVNDFVMSNTSPNA